MRRASLPFLFSLVFPSCGQTAANMPLGLVAVEKFPHLMIQRRVQPRQTLGQILVNRALAHTELSSGGADGGIVVKNVRGQITDPRFNIGMHSHHSPCAALPRFLLHLYEQIRVDMRGAWEEIKGSNACQKQE